MPTTPLPDPCRLVPLALGLLLTLVVVRRRQLEAHARTLLLLTQMLPQSPIKPLSLLTSEPIHERLRLDTAPGAVVGDLFRPAGRIGSPPRRPALILAFGMALHEHDRPVLLGLARAMARLGYVVLWPRLEALEAGAPLPEEPSTFAAAVRHLASHELIDPQRVSIFGFSVGASTALVAASGPAVARHVRAVIFFGGYYDLMAYVASVASRSLVAHGTVAEWQPSEAVFERLIPMLEARGGGGVLKAFGAASLPEAEALVGAAPAAELTALGRLNPAEHAAGAYARVFILHDRGDTFVPYVEALKLRQALPAAQVGSFLLTDLFAHAQPKSGLSWPVMRDIARLYRFVHAALAYL
jgi:acetyl esterase/lipase